MTTGTAKCTEIKIGLPWVMTGLLRSLTQLTRAAALISGAWAKTFTAC